MPFQLNIEGESWSREALTHLDDNETNYILRFCRDWLNDKSEFTFYSSGSTGKPKAIQLSREIMEMSAKKTISALGLQENYSAILCMNPKFIGASMMIVRSMVGNGDLQVIPPIADILGENPTPVDFISMVPIQFGKAMSTSRGIEFLNACGKILIGGSTIDPDLELRAQDLKTLVFHSYGMTETCSHIALRHVNGPNASAAYTTLPGIGVTLSENNCIIIQGDLTKNSALLTTDLGEMVGENTFLIKGRADFVINSGGYKIHPETIEPIIKSFLSKRGYTGEIVVSSVPDTVFGEKCILVVDKKQAFEWKDLLKELPIDPYLCPKEIYHIAPLPLTESKKIDRKALRGQLRLEYGTK